MNLYTLDVNGVAALLRGVPQVMERLEATVAEGHSVMLNAISYVETRRGLTDRHGRKRTRFGVLLQEAGVLDCDPANQRSRALGVYRRGRLAPGLLGHPWPL